MSNGRRKSGRRLSALGVRKLRKPGRYHDGGGHGLYLLVTPSGAKRWEQRITAPGGRRVTLGHKGYPGVSLREARERALQVRALVDNGIDPLLERRTPAVPTFAELVEQEIRARRPDWKHPDVMARRWRQTFERHVYPKLGKSRVTDIQTSHLVSVLEAVQQQHPRSASRIGHQINVVMERALGLGYCTFNACGPAIALALPRRGPKSRPHRSLPYGQVCAALDKVRSCDAWIGMRLLTEFLVLTAVRTNEARGALWSEFDFEQARWTIPAERMKTGAQHCVPLSFAALAVLREARGHPELEAARRRRRPVDPADLVFPTSGGRVFYNNPLSKLLAQLEIGAVPHGFRSSFQTWAAENGVVNDVSERCLAHALRGPYNRSDRYADRIPVMEAWARLVAPSRTVAHRVEPVSLSVAVDPRASSARHLSFPENPAGRDFVVGANGGVKLDHGGGGMVPLRRSKTLPL